MYKKFAIDRRWHILQNLYVLSIRIILHLYDLVDFLSILEYFILDIKYLYFELLIY